MVLRQYNIYLLKNINRKNNVNIFMKITAKAWRSKRSKFSSMRSLIKHFTNLFYFYPLRQILASFSVATYSRKNKMFKFLITVFALVNGVLLCKWVCVDKNNNIKKYYFNQSEVVLELPKREISLPYYQNVKLGRKIRIPGE